MSDKVQGLSLRTWVAGVSVAFAISILVGMGVLSWRNGQQAVDDLAIQLQSRASEQVREHLRAYLASPHKVIRMMRQAVDLGLVDLNRPATIYPYLWRLASIFDGVSYLNYGLEDGHFFGLGRIGPDTPDLHIEEAYPEDISKLHQFPLDARGNRQPEKAVLPFGNFHEQVWYAQPVQAKQPIWTEIYNWEDNPSVIVIGAGEALRDPGGKAIGVAGVDLFLGEISHFLAKLKISPHGRVFILDRQGLFVATSNERRIFRLEADGPQRLSAFQAEDPVVRTATETLGQLPGGLAAIAEVHNGRFSLGGASHYLQVSPWQDSHGLDWLIVLAVPEADFARTIHANNRTVLTWMVAILFVGVASFIWMTGIVTRPARELRDAAQQVAEKRLNTRVHADSRFLEFNQLALSFNRMTEHLQAAFQIAEEARHQLEDKVAERTEELRQANRELALISQLDGLTRIANRHRFDPALKEEWQRAKRHGEPFALIMCDIDYFKQYNDLYGHVQGDEALRQVARTLSNAVSRPGDLVARFGGEEFAILLPNTDREGALQVVEFARRELEALAIEHRGNPLGRLTLSFGVGEMDAEHEFDSAEALLSSADRALYRAKTAGRNRVETA